MALSLTHKGVGGQAGQEAWVLTALPGQPARDPFSTRGAWQPSDVPPHPAPACLNKPRLLLHRNRRSVPE